MSILVHPHAYAPTSPGETLIFTCLLLIGGCVWSQVISRSTAIITSLNREQLSYQQTMDDVNYTCRELNVSRPITKRLRRYFLRTKSTSHHEAWQSLMGRMSPQLRRDSVREVNKHVLQKMKVLLPGCVSFRTDVAEALQDLHCSEQEYFGEPLHM